MGIHPSHETRISDASTFDEICVKCGRTDEVPGGWGHLGEQCPMENDKEKRWEIPSKRQPPMNTELTQLVERLEARHEEHERFNHYAYPEIIEAYEKDRAEAAHAVRRLAGEVEAVKNHRDEFKYGAMELVRKKAVIQAKLSEALEAKADE